MFTNTEITNEIVSLKRFAYKLTRNSTQAEDLLQSTLLRAIEKKDLYQSGTNLFSWASKIMYNIFVSNYRRAVRFETMYDPDIYINNQSVEATQDYSVELSRVNQAMDSLSDDHREILLLVCVMGMAYADVAEQLKIPVGTVRSRLARAREHLQHILGNRSVEDSVPDMALTGAMQQTRRVA